MFKDSTPSKLAFIASLVVGLLSALILFLLNATGLGHIHPFWILLSAVIIFLISFFLFHYILKHFIYDRIRLIYKTIHELKAPKDQKKEHMYDTDDMIRQANREVMEWAKERESEIRELKKMEAYRREFLGNVSHELKTPIFNIQGYVLTLLDGGLEDPAVNRSYLLRSEKSINRMISIIQDLETISLLEAGEVKLTFSQFDLVSIVREVMETMEIEASKKQISLKFGRSYDLPVYVYADKQNIQQVLINLMVNAIKYGKQGGHVKVSFFDMDEHVLTEVTDTGVGIPREELSRIFERFYRGEKSRTRNRGGGSGLGLAIVKHIIDAHHQTINVRSTPGVGSTFAFTLKKGEAPPMHRSFII